MQITQSIEHQWITNFEIKGESYKQICPSNQCHIDYDYGSFTPPYPYNPVLDFETEFEIIDNNITSQQVGPKKGEYLQPFSAAMRFCKITDIVENKGQELYYCQNGFTKITRNFDSKMWTFQSNGVYDAINQTLKVSGNLTGNSPVF